ncbi:MAG: DUF559 domain-containing protein, partial [Sphingorhabdus sp.]
ARLVVEIDGIAHDMGDQPGRDVKRDAWLHSKGLDCVRIAAEDILKDVSGVADGLVRLALSRLPANHTARKISSYSSLGGGRAKHRRGLK